jgi:hypothetical protein
MIYKTMIAIFIFLINKGYRKLKFLWNNIGDVKLLKENFCSTEQKTVLRRSFLALV